ncbi:oxysterol-binding protein/PH domain containing protein [Plasmodium gonderi]|uniref:Oxysterol-binding protein/PH domain containing protein n=1 Tax=Plasmodium gonderi TaxID=77519 RepID=A0A1Y1JI94_PLAGO|nr:oxysterol-binding protein/PH domain containing protein [Plasmodium gonderi]GAW81085.1 oxysterol-binding protein/PH domain containing protein [Plasmodium gonderi]
MLGGKYLNIKLFSEKKNSLENKTVGNPRSGDKNSTQNVGHGKSYNRDKRIIHEGWLNKWTNIIGSYRPRYFVLENGILRYSLDKFSPTKETFGLAHCRIRVCPDDPLHFEIDTSEQGILYLKADFPEDKHKWYISFKKAQLKYLHGSHSKKGYINMNNFNMSTNSEFLKNIIRSTNDLNKSKTISSFAEGKGAMESCDHVDRNAKCCNDVKRKVESCNDNIPERKEKLGNAFSCHTFDHSEGALKTQDMKNINLDEVFIRSTDFEEKSPTLCLMENVVSLKEITRELIKNSEYNEAKSILRKMKSNSSYKINYNNIGTLLYQLSNSIDCIDAVIEKYISCTEMLLKEENIQSKCINKSLKLLAKQNYFLEKSQDKKSFSDLGVKVKNKFEKFNFYENEQESEAEENEDMFFDCDDESLFCDEKNMHSNAPSVENVSPEFTFNSFANEEGEVDIQDRETDRANDTLETEQRKESNLSETPIDEYSHLRKKYHYEKKPHDQSIDETIQDEETHRLDTYEEKDNEFPSEELLNHTTTKKNNHLITHKEENYKPGDSCEDKTNDNDLELIQLCIDKNIKSLNFSKIDIYTDKRIKRRTKLPSPRADIKISMWSLLKDCIGKDLSRIGMPIYLNEPSSFLQRLAEDFQYIYLLKYASNEIESTSRLAYVTAFTISPYASVIGRTFKPFNPLLGETFELTHRKFFFISEQVVHHPPITAYHCHNEYMKNFASITVNVQILGKSVEVTIPGSSHLILRYKKKKNENTHVHSEQRKVDEPMLYKKNNVGNLKEVVRRGSDINLNECEALTCASTKRNTHSSCSNNVHMDVGNCHAYNYEVHHSFHCSHEREHDDTYPGGYMENVGREKSEKRDSYKTDLQKREDSENVRKNNHLLVEARQFSLNGNNNKIRETNDASVKRNISSETNEHLKKGTVEDKGNGKGLGTCSPNDDTKDNGMEYDYEHYTYQRANMVIHNIIFGKLWVELHGNILIRNHNNGDFSIVNYMRKGWFDKEIHKVRGIVCDRFKNVIFYIYGKWSQEINIAYVKDLKRQEYNSYFFNDDGTENLNHFNRDTLNEFINNVDWQFYENHIEKLNVVCMWKAAKRPKHSDLYYGFNNMTVELNEITPEYDKSNGASIACTDSRFRPDQRSYENGNIEVAMNEKQRLENKQRMNSKKYTANNSYKPKWFYKNKDPIYKDKDMYLFNNEYWIAKENRLFTDSPDIF